MSTNSDSLGHSTVDPGNATFLGWRPRILSLLAKWAAHAEQCWYALPDAPEPCARAKRSLGCYGTGCNAWGVQTNQKYVSALAVLGTLGEQTRLVPPEACRRARDRALAALRFSLWSHVSGDGACTGEWCTHMMSGAECTT